MYSYGPPPHGRAKAGRPAWTYIQQLCEDTGCSPEDLPEAMNDRRSGERAPGISVLAARHDDVDDEFFTPALANGFSLEFEWQQVSSRLQGSAQYSGLSQQCCSLDGLQLSSYFQVLPSLYQSFGDCTECISYNWYHCHIFHDKVNNSTCPFFLGFFVWPKLHDPFVSQNLKVVCASHFQWQILM